MIEQIPVPDLRFMLGFFTALALRRGRVDSIIGGMMKFFPNEKNPGFGTGNDGKAKIAETSDEDPRPGRKEAE